MQSLSRAETLPALSLWIVKTEVQGRLAFAQDEQGVMAKVPLSQGLSVPPITSDVSQAHTLRVIYQGVRRYFIKPFL